MVKKTTKRWPEWQSKIHARVNIQVLLGPAAVVMAELGATDLALPPTTDYPNPMDLELDSR